MIFAALAAILVASFLRHTLHIHGGISPGDIRARSLSLISAVGIIVVFVRVLWQILLIVSPADLVRDQHRCDDGRHADHRPTDDAVDTGHS